MPTILTLSLTSLQRRPEPSSLRKEALLLPAGTGTLETAAVKGMAHPQGLPLGLSLSS